MPRPERNGTCEICDGKVRYYPPVEQIVTADPNAVDSFPPNVPAGKWAHLDRADWIDNPHEPAPTKESIAAAQAVDA
ncbi:hypothetical protein [Mycolicibacterium komossense]|uniref:Uncharacterized protein n=1 Tax=Mycolicibacterium komossense TaxID=1779 RepID=A0ABT3CMC1_9MYCO|nr:hypothetical protein [Mycolicibacterium komossense]MCV7230646.1 hypothetical protein [Mycolicibacterium komossense]